MFRVILDYRSNIAICPLLGAVALKERGGISAHEYSF